LQDLGEELLGEFVDEEGVAGPYVWVVEGRCVDGRFVFLFL
jgi:hypothetical protein